MSSRPVALPLGSRSKTSRLGHRVQNEKGTRLQLAGKIISDAAPLHSGACIPKRARHSMIALSGDLAVPIHTVLRWAFSVALSALVPSALAQNRIEPAATEPLAATSSVPPAQSGEDTGGYTLWTSVNE